MVCDYCSALQQKELIVFQDDQLAVLFHPQPALKGHLLVIPKEHCPILEQVSHDVVASMFVHANKASLLLFEQLEAKGVNLLIQNGISAGQKTPHTAIEVIPRFFHDGLELSWDTKTLTEEDMNLMENKLKEEAENIILPVENAPQQKKEEPLPPVIPEENYLIKHLRRIP